MGKFKMPTVSEFLSMKTMYDEKKDPIWVILEREMQANIAVKPYNEKVGEWLRFLKELKYYFHCEARRKLRRLRFEAGPPWFVELSTTQREVLANMREVIHQDVLEDVTRRMRASLSDLGITMKLSSSDLMKAMINSFEDPGVFIWNLYKAVYKKSPSELLSRYDMNAMIMMSSIVCIDLKECIERLEKLTHYKKVEAEVKVKKQKREVQPMGRYAEYLQTMHAPVFTHPKRHHTESGPLPIGYKFQLKTAESLDRLRNDESFLEKRKERNKKEKEAERICTYKFWEPPSSLRTRDPAKAALANKQKMLKKKATLKFIPPQKNVTCIVGGVCFSGGRPNYMISVVTLPTGCTFINGGMCLVQGEFVTNIQGAVRFPRNDAELKESKSCDCVEKWEKVVMDYLNKAKCRCFHFYDFGHEPPPKNKEVEKYLYPATRHGPFWIDRSKIYQFDPMEDLIKSMFNEAIKSAPSTATLSEPVLSASELKEKDLLATFLSDLSDSPLIIPHLPMANCLNSLLEWVRKRVKGKLTPADEKKMMLHSQRRWLDLKHMDFKALAFKIPFTEDQLHHINWSHRRLVQKLFLVLLNDFVSRNRLRQLEQTRLWWSTMKFDAYPGKSFLDIYYTYMPGRMKDVFLVNPYSSMLTKKSGSKTCPLGL